MKIERLNAAHYDEIISLLNEVFTRKNGRKMDFEREMPKMCVRDDEHMGCHIGIFEDGRLVACMGIYPFDVTVAGQKLRFATTGNVAVHWDYEGRGYMGKMLDAAMDELVRIDADAARLGGLRSRYNRYGFEACGANYYFTFTEKNRLRKFPDLGGGITFTEIRADDADALEFTAALYNQNAICVPRNAKNAYSCLTMWQNAPYLATRHGKPIGYVCSDASKKSIAEMDAVDTLALSEIVCAWQETVGANIYFYRMAHQIESVRVFTKCCEGTSIASPSHFKICKWERVIDAFIKLKATYSSLVEGELCIEIEGYGRLLIYSIGKDVGCKRCDREPDVKLDALTAARYLFGPHPPVCTADAPALAEAWLPLPLSWNGQDRV